ncbi:MAG: rod shape-determining protein MreD [Balneolaceae bacterium]|nr:rod shape-determining protein MreD [Balneolaceae bacterium]MCH8547273.1 rod shape-determining protein MreD [Balneolaceae bacterium]
MNRSDTLRTLLYGIAFVVIQVVLFRNLRVFEAEVDIVLIFILWLCTRKSRTQVLLYAALLGFMQDAMSDLWGLHMFSKTLLVFILHSYLNRISENQFMFWQIFLILLAITMVHNLIFLGLSLFSSIYSAGFIFWSLLLVGSLLTSVTGSFLHLVRSER